jgi:uncharacterized protein (TIGR03437 family)
LFYASPLQINAQLPFEIAPGQASLVVTADGASSASAAFTVAASAPGILTYGTNRAVAVNQDVSLNGPDKPALAGSVVTVYMTGEGAVDTPVATGAASSFDPVSRAVLPVTATIGGRTADVMFAGLSPGGVGLFQVNVRVPAGPSGDALLVVTIGAVASNAVALTVLTPGGLPQAPSIVRTMAYHQVTSLPDTGPDFRTSTVLSGNGALIAFSRSSKPLQILVMNFDGTGQRQVDSYTALCSCGAFVDISDDGSKIVSTEGRQIRLVDAQGVHALVKTDTGISGIKLQGDGRRVFFLVDRDGNLLGSTDSTPVQRGLYVINADGSGLRQIVGPNAVAALFGTAPAGRITPEFTVAGNAPNHSLGVVQDGTRIVFGARKAAGSGPDAIFGVNLDGSGLHFVIGPVPYVQHLGISSDGSKALYDTNASGALVDQIGVVNFDGSGQRVLRNSGSPSLENPAGAALQLSADGSVLLAYDMLYSTDGSGVLQISTTFNSLTPGRPVMNATATRFVYAFVPPGTYSQGLSQLATMEINPVSLGSAPLIANPVLNPPYVIPGDVFRGVVTAQIGTTDKVLGISYAIVRDGLVEAPYNADVFLVDDGTTGDQIKGDGVFTSNRVRAPSGPSLGSRMLRLFAQVSDAAGKRSATLVDVAPFSAVSQPPTN